MPTDLNKKDPPAQARRALTATGIVASLGKTEGWKLVGDGDDIAIERSFHFANYYETMAFVNAVAFIAHTQDHHPALQVHYNQCVVRFNTHDVKGLSMTDFECAAHVNALVANA